MKNITDEPVIVPWDFSDESKKALDQAIELVKSPDQITVVHVTPYPPATEYSVIWGTYNEDQIRDNLVKSFRKEMPGEKYAKLKFTSLFGDPGTGIVKLAKDLNAGLIVISSHGRTGISRLLLGSVAERVVRLAPCPILVLRSSS